MDHNFSMFYPLISDLDWRIVISPFRADLTSLIFWGWAAPIPELSRLFRAVKMKMTSYGSEFSMFYPLISDLDWRIVISPLQG
jgi:hypothetical protein